ncbi:MAG: serine/threonine-protein kinase [Planctomycetaceae bacterium]
MDCPSEEVLRAILEDVAQDTNSTDVISHLEMCRHCRDRISSWDLNGRLNEILDAAGNSGIAYENPNDSNPDDGSDALTNVYGVTPIRLIGQYELLRSVGHGGVGEVFEAIHTHLRRRVAVKLLSKKNCENEANRKRFFQEMVSIGRLDHPNIVHAYDAGEIEGTLYLAMEFVEGLNLEVLAQRIGPMESWDACELIRQAAVGLQHIYESGLVHRDLKPSNLLVSRSGVKIADLGLAMFSQAESTQGLLIARVTTDDRLTGEHTVLGTVDYMAPEQAEESREVDIRADLYSLGCTLFRLLVGRAPYALPENSTPFKKMMAHASDPIPDIRRFRPDLSDELVEVINRLLQKSRVDRYSEPRQLVEALTPFSGVVDFPTLIISSDRPQRKVIAGGRSSTLRDSEIRRSEASTPQAPYSNEQSGLPRQPPVSPPQTEQLLDSANKRLTKYSLATIVVSACLILLLVGLGSLIPRMFKKDEVPGNANGPIMEIPKKRTDLEEVWFRQFNSLPQSLDWSKKAELGTGRFLENDGVFNIHAGDRLQLVEFGELNENDVNISLEMSFDPRPRDASCGYYFGFRKKNIKNGGAEFQAIEFQLDETKGQAIEVLVMRHLKVIDGNNRLITTKLSSHERVCLNSRRGSVRYSVKLAGDRLVGVSVGGVDCKEIVLDDENAKFNADDYRGSFGVFVGSGTIDIQDPKFSRN